MYFQAAFEFIYRKQLFDCTYRHERKRRRYHQKCAINIILSFLRVTTACVSVKNGWFDYFEYDVFGAFVFDEMNRNAKLYLPISYSFLLFCVFLLMNNYLFHRTKNFPIMDIALDIGKRNIDDFHRTNQLTPPLQLNIFRIKMLQFVHRYSRLENWLVSQNRIAWEKYENIDFSVNLHYYSFISKSIRFKALTIHSILESLLTATFFEFLFVFIILSIAYAMMNWENYGVLVALAAALDLAWVGWEVGWESIKMSYIQLCNSITMCSTFIMAFNDITEKIKQNSTTDNMKQLLMQTHAQVTKVVLQTGDENLSMLMYTFLIVNIPISEFLLTYIIYADISLVFQVMMDIVVFLITLALLITLVPPALVNKASKKPSKIMPRIQQEIKSNNIRLKLKYMSYYEQLTSNKIGFKVGPFGTITINIIVEVCTDSIDTII